MFAAAFGACANQTRLQQAHVNADWSADQAISPRLFVN